ncbi:hypothetical protein ANN_22369 [Periplaneta americana]|uniref:Uncharacterized protein n=1 Tax=Periplaneta americana TaxID=6978 RepID=A0ABQ8S8F7_PERAM|nr:hypothetical protein ANN_22369 [Periplaneta americana]
MYRSGTADHQQRFCNEPEILSHVFDSCPRRDLLRNSRIRTKIAPSFFQSHEEVLSVAQEGGNRRMDIIVITVQSLQGSEHATACLHSPTRM